MIVKFDKLLERPYCIFFFLFGLGALIYSNTLNGEFCSDDFRNIVENSNIRDVTNLTKIWYSFNTRFLVGLSFAFNYALGGLDVFGYHIFNLLSHILASFLVYLFVLITFKTSPLVNSLFYEKRRIMAFFASLVFLTHPAQTQGVSFITQRSVSLATIFYLGTLIFYIRARIEKRSFFFWGALSTMLLGLLTKEMIVSLPLTIIVYEIFFLKSLKDNFKQTKFIIFLLCLVAVLLPILLNQDKEDSVLGLKYQLMGRPFNWNYFFTEINVLRTYLRIFLLPMALNHSYDYPIAKGLWEFPTIFSILVMMLLFTGALVQYSRHRLMSFTIIWFFITTSVEFMHVCFVNKGVIYDHWMYLPMVGFAIFLPSALVSYLKDLRIVRNVCSGIIVIFCLLTFQRNQDWRSCIVLWEDVLKKSPQDPLPYANLGVLYSRKGELDKAIDYYNKALKSNREIDSPRLAQIYVNLGATYGRKGDYLNEVASNLRALKLDPYNFQAYSNLGIAYALIGEYDKALQYARRAIALNPQYSDGYNNLGVIHVKRGEMDLAKDFFKMAHEIDPANRKAYENYQIMLSGLTNLRREGQP